MKKVTIKSSDIPFEKKKATIPERLIDFIKENKRVSGRQVTDEFGNFGCVWSALQRFIKKEIITDEKCECGNSHFYSLKHK